MRPNSKKYNPNPDYLKHLFLQLKDLGITRVDVCKRIGVPYRTMSDYLNKGCPVLAPYTVQFAVEQELEYMCQLRVGEGSSSKKDVDIGESRL